MSSQLRRIIIRALALPFALALAVAGLTTTEIAYLRELARAVSHTQRVLFSASRAYRLVVDQETGIRGYLLTGAPEFLEPFAVGQAQVEEPLRQLSVLLADDGPQAARVEAARRAIAAWQGEAARAVALARGGEAGRAQASQLAVQRQGKALMDGIRARLDEITGEELGDLEEEQHDFARQSRAVVLGGGVLVLLLAAAVAFVLRRQILAIEAVYRRALTEREASEQREREARGQAEAANRTKDEFLATVSHELRTPLTAMLGWARLLRGRQVADERRERAVEAIERNAVAQAQLIEDLLDVSRITSGKLRLELHETDLRAVIDAAVESMRPAAEAKRIRLQVMLDPAGADVLGDPNRLQQVVWNLLANAIKFTPKEGKVSISLSRINSHVELAVRDTGQGIDPTFIPRLFQRFQQEDSRESRNHGGLGLGLAISRHLVELHGGTIEAASEGPGTGAVFTVKLPLSPVAARGAGTAAPGAGAGVGAGAAVAVHPSLGRDVKLECPPELAGLKVLVVDDEPDSREVVAAVVAGCGCVVREAASADAALEVVRAFRPHVIVSDVGMPGEDGYQMVSRLRQLSPEEGGRTPAAALTAYARAEDRRLALRAGFEMHLPKPVEPAELVAAVATLARIGEAMK